MGDPRRRFNGRERAALYLAANGRCAHCGIDLAPSWHADHVRPRVADGPTDVVNGQALCPSCNLIKGANMSDELRDWQRTALESYDAAGHKDYLVSATPGAGKTTFALTLARRLLDQQVVERVLVVVPTDALRAQWTNEAARFGIDLVPVAEPEDYDRSDFHGAVATFAQLGVGAGSDLARRACRRPTLTLIDEIHHAGDKQAWGDGLRRACELATRRLGLTGTPWRRTNSPIPFVRYDVAGEVIVDSAYEYGAAVADGVCRRIEFPAYDGQARWVDNGTVRTTRLGDGLSADATPAVLDTILSPDREWMPGVIGAAVTALREMRVDVPDAGGLVVADTQEHARRYAEMIESLTGQPVVIAVSDDPEARAKIDRFRNERDPWLVAVRMVSEGIDIPRLAIGVFGAKTRTPLFFRQVVGRFVRVRPGEEVNARLFIPAVPAFTSMAKEIEDELRHQLDVVRESDEKSTAEAAAGRQQLELHQPLSASDPALLESIFGGESLTAREHAAAEAQCRAVGIPTSFAPQVAQLMARLGGTRPVADVTVTPTPAPEPKARRARMLRTEIAAMVSKIAQRTGRDYRDVNAEILRQGFPQRAKSSVDDLERLHSYLARTLGGDQ